MATNNSKYDPLRNPQVDYDRSDLSPKGILYFLVGLFIAGVFIELVIWGMFRFMAHSEVLFPQPKLNPMVSSQKLAPATPGSVLQNTPAVNLSLFPQPRLQTNDAGEMSEYLGAEQKLLHPDQPFTDPSGAVHISISQAMKLIEERGLPVRPNKPPPDPEESMASGTNAPGAPAGSAAVPASKPAADATQ